MYDGAAPKRHKQIRFHLVPTWCLLSVHLVFGVDHDGRQKARVVADGNLTNVSLSSVYSGVISLRGVRLVLL